jgi:Uma2 family endonuclease
MVSASSVCLDEYLNSGLPAEWEYVDAELVPRGGGSYRHSTVVSTLILRLGQFRDILRLQSALVLWITESRFRVPDVTCYLRSVHLDHDEITKQPPLAVFEIISKTDPMVEIREKCDEYRQIGVEHIFMIDAFNREVMVPTRGFTVVADAIEFPAGDRTIRIPVADLFADLD